MHSVTLHTGARMPLVGLGTFKIRGNDVLRSLDAALSAGYRSIDTAAVYRNEAEICTSLKELLPKYGLSRSDLFITSKLGPKDQGASACRKACLHSLEQLGMEYLDLYLIHWPGTQGMKPDDPRHPQLRTESWQDLQQLCKEGKLRAIGVSNYTLGHMKELLENCEIKPAVLQVEYHPHLVQKPLVALCQEHGIHFQAYSSLGTSIAKQLLSDPVVCEVATRISKSPAQVLLRWAVQQNIGVLPKSTNPQHIAENIDLFNFTLTDEDMEKLSNSDQTVKYAWDPSCVH